MMQYVLLMIMTMLGSAGALFLKKASTAGKIMDLLKSVNIYLGGGLYFLSALMNIYLLRYMDYSVVLPLTSLTYIWTMFLSRIILHESITSKKIIGVMFVFIGAIFVAI